MSEDRVLSITSSSHLAPDDVARHTFGTVRRGFNPSEVRAYLESIAVALRGIAEREHQFLENLAAAEHRAAHPVLDEATLTSAVGAETARVLHSAHEAAAEVEAKATAESERMLTEARQEIDRLRTDTETRLAEQTAAAEAAIDDLRQRTDQQIASGLGTARREAEEALGKAREQCRAMVDEAQGLRARVLADLSKRRKVLHAQIEQLRAGRERLTETVQDVRRSIDTIAEDLFAAEDNARLAAEAAGREAAGRSDEATPEELAAALLLEEAASTPAAEPHPADVEPELAEGPPLETGDGDDQATGGGHADSPVDALFAKLRAASGESVGSEPPPAADPGTGANAAPDTTADPEPAASVAPVAPEAAPPPEVTGADPTPDGEADRPPDDRHPAAVRRDELIAPIVTALARRLKRTLQDTQNELLDGLRAKGATWSMDLLPSEVEHVDAVATAALPSLEQGAEAGVAFAEVEGAPGPKVDVLAGLAHTLAEEMVGPLRRRLADDSDGLAGADEPVVIEHVGSAFREWKGERIERLAGDHLVAAFSAGTLAATAEESSALLEWVAVGGVDDAPCPDCEDNGLSGPQRSGEEFPTGHLHPPAHPGCRCLLSPSAT